FCASCVPSLLPPVIDLKLQLNARLKELSFADKIKAVEGSIPICELEPDIVRKIPVHHRCESPEASATDRAAIEIGLRESGDKLQGSRAALKDRTVRRDLIEESPTGVVTADFAGRQPRHHHIATVEKGVPLLRRIHIDEKVFRTE